MIQQGQTLSTERLTVIRWVAEMGAVTAEALAHRQDTSVASARAQLLAASRARILSRRRPLMGYPSLYAATNAGLRACGLGALDPCRVSASNARHLIACAEVAVALESCYPDHLVRGERELRRDERGCGSALASAHLGIAPGGGQLLHRPDLVLWPTSVRDGGPIAVEVELTIKAPKRLADICRAWARCRCVSGVLYLAPPDVAHALERAIQAADAQERIALIPLGALPGRPCGASG